MALLAAEAVLAVLLLPLVVAVAAAVAALAGAEGALLARVVALELLLDGDVEQVVGLVRAEGRGRSVLALWEVLVVVTKEGVEWQIGAGTNSS